MQLSATATNMQNPEALTPVQHATRDAIQKAISHGELLNLALSLRNIKHVHDLHIVWGPASRSGVHGRVHVREAAAEWCQVDHGRIRRLLLRSRRAFRP